VSRLRQRRGSWRAARTAWRRGWTPSAAGIRTFSFNGWHVAGDLRPVHDRYVATKAGAVVRWRF
jgi:hypothetical protein